MRPFIQDQERVLNAENDLLKTRGYADNLVKVIENSPKDRVFTIGVFGGWGTGKSSVIKTAQDTIEKAHKDVKFITYDAWKYSNDSFRRMFLLKIQQELKMRQTSEMSRFYQSEMVESEPKTTLSAKGVALAVVVVGIISIILFLIPSVRIEWKVAIPTLGTLGTFLFALLNGCFYDLHISYSKPSLFAPEQFESCFKEMMSKCLKRKNWFQKKWSAVKDFVEADEKSVVGLERLIIVIDNIDRCPSDMAYQLLTDIKTFLSNAEYSIVFIVPVDDEALKKHLFRRWKQTNEDDINKEKEEFLRKFFNVSLRIKPHQVAELQHFAHKINEENHLGYNNDTLAIVSKEFADNPRRIIQLLNNLSGELALYEDEFPKIYETPICAALILREEYPSFYKEATKDLNVILDYKKENKSLSAFMRISDSIFRRTPIDALHRIFTNTASIFTAIPVDIQQSVKTFDTSTVIDFVKDNSHLKENLLDFVFAEAKSDAQYGASSQATQWIDCLCVYNEAFPFDHSRFNSIEESLSEFYLSAIKETGNANLLCRTARDMASVGFIGLKDLIIAYLNSDSSRKNVNYSSILTTYLTYFQSEKDSKAISSAVGSYYTDTAINREIPYSEEQVAILFGDSFVAKQVQALSSMDDEPMLDKILWCLSRCKSLSKETYEGLFGKFITLFGGTRGKSKDDFLKFIRTVQPILNVIKTYSLPKAAASIYEFVTNKWKTPHPNYINYPQHDALHSLVEEVNEEEAVILATFICGIVRISGGTVKVSSSVNVLFPKCKDVFLSAALSLSDEGVPLASIANTLASAKNYDSKETLDVLEIILSRQPNGSMMLNKDVIEMKVRDLVDNSSVPGVEQLLARLSKDDQIQGIVSAYVTTLDSKTANSLPLSIIKNAISIFNRNNAEDFIDNISFLTLVMEKGTASQKASVVTLMLEKILHEEDLENALFVLNSLETENQSRIKEVIRALESLMEKESVDDDIKNRISALKSKLTSMLKEDKPRMKISFGKKKK